MLTKVHLLKNQMVNRQLPPQIVSFVNYPMTLTKLQLPPEIA